MQMLRLTATLRPSRNIFFPRKFTPRCFSSDDSHDDFKPKRKTVPEGMDAVMALIDDQVKTSDIMLYMKGKYFFSNQQSFSLL